jgi:hypothetical protein
MASVTAPAPQAIAASNNGDKPINLFQLGCLFVIRVSYWSCRAGNEPDELNLSADRIERRAIASFGTKDLIDPVRGRSVFATLEKQARHALAKVSQLPAAGAHFVPWQHAAGLIEQLERLRQQFDTKSDELLAGYAQLKADWQLAHPDVPGRARRVPIAARRAGVPFAIPNISTVEPPNS